VILRLIFEGIGSKNMSEIRNLKESDINWEEKTLTLTNNLKEDEDGFPTYYEQRILKVDDRTLYLLEGAIKQKTYIKKNKYAKERDNIRPYTALVENDYVIRASVTNTMDSISKPINKFVIYRRVSTISETLGIDNLTPKLIQRSGMLYFASQMTTNKNIELGDIKIISNRFNIKSYYNLKGFITDSNIQKTYRKKSKR